VVLKPSEMAPSAALLLAEVFAEAGLPPGVCNVVVGTGPQVGAALAAHPGVDMVSSTGSTAAGRLVGRAAADTVKWVALELGGKSASVLLPDADPPKAVKATVDNAFLSSGQTAPPGPACWSTATSTTRWPRWPASSPRGWRAGWARSRRRHSGTACRATCRPPRRGWSPAVQDASTATTVGTSAARPSTPTCPPTPRSRRTEIFGPVLSVIPYTDEDDAVAIANGTPYGLAGAVWSADREAAVAFVRRMRTGQVDINCARFNPIAPFGGYGQSGNGRELGPYGLDEYNEIKSIQLA